MAVAGRAMDGVDREAAILSAADDIFGECGFDGASVRAVAERAGVNKALVFYYFRSKEQLYDRVLERYYTGHRDAMRAAYEAGGDLRDRFHRLIDAYLDFISENRTFARLVQGQVAGNGQHLDPIRRNLETLFGWTTRALEDVGGLDGPLASRHFFVTFSGAVINYFTYAPVLESVWGEDPLSDGAVAERRAHLHWLIDAVMAQLVPTASGRAGVSEKTASV